MSEFGKYYLLDKKSEGVIIEKIEVCNFPNGCIMRTSTIIKLGGNTCSESSVFVPDYNIDISSNPRKIVKVTEVKKI